MAAGWGASAKLNVRSHSISLDQIWLMFTCLHCVSMSIQLVPLGTFVTDLNASSPNSPNGPMTYYVAYNGFGSASTPDFQIDTTTGVITTARKFLYEGGKTFVVSIPWFAV